MRSVSVLDRFAIIESIKYILQISFIILRFFIFHKVQVYFDKTIISLIDLDITHKQYLFERNYKIAIISYHFHTVLSLLDLKTIQYILPYLDLQKTKTISEQGTSASPFDQTTHFFSQPDQSQYLPNTLCFVPFESC